MINKLYCTYCGKKIKEGQYSSREGHIKYFFFHLFKKDIWESYFCTTECDVAFHRDKK